MENLIAVLLTFSILGLLVGLVRPHLFTRILKARATRRGVALIFGSSAILLFIIFAVVAEPVEREDVGQAEITQQENVEVQTTQATEGPTEQNEIDFEVLREWNPDGDPQAIGQEILIDEVDATEQNIVAFVREVSEGKQKMIIKIYQDKRAWEEEQTGDYTDASNSGYLAFYVKNTTASGAYRGFNEIRWFQGEGQLGHLNGTVTKVE